MLTLSLSCPVKAANIDTTEQDKMYQEAVAETVEDVVFDECQVTYNVDKLDKNSANITVELENASFP